MTEEQLRILRAPIQLPQTHGSSARYAGGGPCVGSIKRRDEFIVYDGKDVPGYQRASNPRMFDPGAHDVKDVTKR
jgi:hypothetical protein